MEISADVSKISKTVQRDLICIWKVSSESTIHFAYVLTVLAEKNVVNFIWHGSYQTQGCVTMGNYEWTT